MRRLSIVPLIAAAIVVGHVAPHLLASHWILDPAVARDPAVTWDRAVTRRSPLRTESPLLVAPTCRLQPPPAVGDREPMLDALRQLIAREEKRYPYLADNDRTMLARFEPCGVIVRRHSDIR
jgi:hypothetical protein